MRHMFYPDTPKISVVVPTYNQVDILCEAVASIRAQTFEDWQMVVVDDGSAVAIQNDLRRRIADLSDPRITVVCSTKNRGPARTRNLGIRLSQARYLAFIDADDLWEPDKLARQYQDMHHRKLALSCTGYKNLNVKTGAYKLVEPSQALAYASLLKHNTIGCSTVMLDRAQLGTSYFPDIPMRQDFAHWLNLLKRDIKAEGLRDPLTVRRLYSNSLSANKARAAYYTWKMYRDVEELSFFKTAWVFAHYAASGVLRKLYPTKTDQAQAR